MNKMVRLNVKVRPKLGCLYFQCSFLLEGSAH
jgi:hypothetical protein